MVHDRLKITEKTLLRHHNEHERIIRHQTKLLPRTSKHGQPGRHAGSIIQTEKRRRNAMQSKSKAAIAVESHHHFIYLDEMATTIATAVASKPNRAARREVGDPLRAIERRAHFEDAHTNAQSSDITAPSSLIQTSAYKILSPQRPP